MQCTEEILTSWNDAAKSFIPILVLEVEMSLTTKILEAIAELEKKRIGKEDIIILAPGREMTILLEEWADMEVGQGYSMWYRQYDKPTRLGGVIIICDDFQKLIVRSLTHDDKRVEVEYDG